MKSFINQPLVHFLLIGLGFFILFQFFGDGNDTSSRTIVVDKESLMNFYQYRSKAFNREVFEARLASMPRDELDQMINDYIRQEVLYREAMAMGLEQEDFIIKQRLIQKVEFISQGIAEAVTELSEEEIREYYEENKKDYFLQPYATFTHVFFDFEKWGADQAKAKAEAELSYLNNNQITFNQAPSRGDRFFYFTNYVEKDPEYVESHFGPKMTDAIFASAPSDNTWIGPFYSEYGYHLVMVTKNKPGRYPDLEEVISSITEDARREHTQMKNEETIQAIIDEYDVRVEVDLEVEAKAEAKAKDEDEDELNLQ